MTENDKDKETGKAAMKELRSQRKDLIAKASLTMKTQKKNIKTIKEFLKDKPAIVPDIAKGIDMPKDQTLWYIATMKKYGQIVEGQKEGAFFNYSLILNETENNEEKAEV